MLEKFLTFYFLPIKLLATNLLVAEVDDDKKVEKQVWAVVTGDDFFDRDPELALLTRNIESGGNHTLIVAPRRVGKTSLIRETFRRLEQNGTHYLIFLDIQNCTTPEDVIVVLSMGAAQYRTLTKKVTDVFSTFLKQISESVDTFGSPDLLEIKLREAVQTSYQRLDS